MAKGGKYERELCTELSLWWSGGESDAIFWRTSNSGGRATVRGKKGKRTVGQEGDVTATDPSGLPLTRLLTIEAKRGYPQAHLGDLLDLRPQNNQTRAERPLEGFLLQSQREAKAQGTPFWLLVVRRNQREAMAYLPWVFARELKDVGADLSGAPGFSQSHLPRPASLKLVSVPLKDFLLRVSPSHVKTLVRELC